MLRFRLVIAVLVLCAAVAHASTPPPAERVARLLPPRPNPFAQRTEIAWQLARSDDVLLRVLDVQGRVVRILAAGRREPGLHRVTFDAAGLPNGLYVCQLRAGGRVESRPLVRLR